MYSLFGFCKAAGVNPRKWLTDVLTRIPEYNNDYNLDLADLLPHNWKASPFHHQLKISDWCWKPSFSFA